LHLSEIRRTRHSRTGRGSGNNLGGAFSFYFFGGWIMSGKTDQAKGRIKEAAGAITDDDKLRREGKTDQVVGKVKEAAEKTIDKVRDATKRGESCDK
jgi:uncharacterized protein YjbJ (UPF0337 family)